MSQQIFVDTFFNVERSRVHEGIIHPDFFESAVGAEVFPFSSRFFPPDFLNFPQISRLKSAEKFLTAFKYFRASY